jgi:hypothetical protein
MSSYSVGIAGSLPDTADEIAECLERVVTASKECRGKNCTWSLSEDPTHVIHVVPKQSDKDIAIMEQLSNELLVPKITVVKTCGDKTFTVSEAAIPATMVEAGPIGGIADIRVHDIDYITRMTGDEQKELVNLCVRLVESGRIHMHCTLAAIGFTKSGARFIDLQGLQNRTYFNGKDKLYALALCLLQMLERVPVKDLDKTLIFRVAMAAISGSHIWGEDLDTEDIKVKHLISRYPIRESKTFSSRVNKVTDTNADIYLGVMYYAAILATDDRNENNEYVSYVLSQLKKIRSV